MTPDGALLRILLATFGAWISREQCRVIEYLIEENRVLKEQLGGRRLRLSDAQRRRLAAKGKPIGRRLLAKIATIVSPDTILAWHRRLIAKKWTFERKRAGRPGVMKEIASLVVRMAKENSGWGYRRIQGALKNLGHQVASSTIAKILKDHGIPPAPERPTSWQTFLKSHADVLVGADFFTVEVWTARGLVTHYVLFLIHHASRAVHVAGVTPNPDAAFMAQIARNLTDHVEGFLRDKRFLIIDRDAKYTDQFRRILKDAGVAIVRTAYRTPNQNATAERFVLTIKSECLNKVILFGEESLQRAISAFVEHYHLERNHRSLDNGLVLGVADETGDRIAVRERLGGLLKYYHRSAA